MRRSGRRIPAALLLTCAAVLMLVVARPIAQVEAQGAAAASADAKSCAGCHAVEVKGFQRSKMSASMSVGSREPAGVVRLADSTVTMFSDARGSWQRLSSHGITSTYRADYVIGSGDHARGYLVRLGDHLFQSPVAYYTRRSAYDLAPGYEKVADPDFTRPVGEGCLFCHAGAIETVAGSTDRFATQPFSHLTISCDRCHGSAAAHLSKPIAGNIVNPESLEPAARDSVCEQCHLIGAARVLNPGKRFADFKAGERLEDTFTIYHDAQPTDGTANFRVISHSEQLALSACARGSKQQLWCGTCHNPHAEPLEPVAYYRRKCLACHAQTAFAPSHPPTSSNCIGCHMPTREAKDGGHTVFTDHRIQRRPEQGTAAPDDAPIAPWRQPPIELAQRNDGIAAIEVGLERHSAKDVVAGYRALVGVQEQFSQDSDMFNMLGVALSAGRQYAEAVQAFSLALRFRPDSSPIEDSLAQVYLAMGDEGLARPHLERAVQIDPLNLSAAMALRTVYERSGEDEKAEALSRQLAAFARAGQSVP